jgi:hypothetical protein
MSLRWEYASVVWTDSLRKVTPADPEFELAPADVRVNMTSQGLDFAYWCEQKFYIWLPGASEADIRVSWETGEGDLKVTVLDVFNEVGADGWELVSQTVKNNAMGRSQGRDTTSFPIRIQTLFKRPIPG